MRLASPSWIDRSWLVGLCALVVYVALASPYVVAADNAEFAALGALGGGAHPSGYPLYVLWLRAWSWLPGATAAHTAALATAIVGGLSIAVLHAACRAWGARPAAATISVAIVGAAPIVLQYHTEAEVFAMNGLVGGLVVWLAAANGPLRGRWRAAALGLVAGAGLAHHLTCVLVAPVGILGVVRAARESRASAWGVAVVGLAVGLAPYAYLFVADGPASWGTVASPSALLATILRREYGSFDLNASGAVVPWTASVAACLATVGRSWLWLPAVAGAAMLGVRIWRPALERRSREDQDDQRERVALERRSREDQDDQRERGALERRSREDQDDQRERVALERRGREDQDDQRERGALETRWAWAMLAASLVLAGPLLASRFNIEPRGIGLVIVRRFHLLPTLLLAIPVAAACDVVVARLARPRAAAVAAIAGFAALVIAALPGLVRLHSPAMERGVQNLLRTLPASAIVVVISEDQCFGARYLQLTRGERPDVALVCSELLRRPWYRAAWARRGLAMPAEPASLRTGDLRTGFARRSSSGETDQPGAAFGDRLLATARPVFVDRGLTGVLAAFPSYPFGVVARVLPRGAAPPPAGEVAIENRELYRRFDLDYPRPGRDDGFAAVAHRRYAASWAAIAELLEAAGDRDGARDAIDVARSLQPAQGE